MPEAKAKVGSEVHERLCRARAFINERYHLPIDLDEISRSFSTTYVLIELVAIVVGWILAGLVIAKFARGRTTAATA
jgi:hypothetical protein